MNVLVSGGGGYIGSTLIGLLLERGHNVTCLDRFFFGEESLSYLSGNSHLTIIKDDVRWFNPKILKNIDAVIDMAAISNDPAGELDPAKTFDINWLGRGRCAKLSKKYGVSRYVLASSCSVYGFQEGMITEESTPNPLTTYAEANILAEKEILPLSDNDFCATALRQATVYGLSHRMRFDLAINGMTLGIFRNGVLPVMRDGTQWRPFVYVKDTSKAFIKVIETEDTDLVSGQIFNVGDNSQNYQIFDLAKRIVGSVRPETKLEWYGDADVRSYRVDFSKIAKTLNYKVEHTPEIAAKEIYTALENNEVSTGTKTITLQWYKHLMESQEITKKVSLKDSVL